MNSNSQVGAPAAGAGVSFVTLSQALDEDAIATFDLVPVHLAGWTMVATGGAMVLFGASAVVVDRVLVNLKRICF